MILRLIVSIALMICTCAKAAVSTIDFSGVDPQEIVTTQFPGVTISLLGSAPIAGPRAYALNDTEGHPQNVLGATGIAITPSQADATGGVQPPFYDMQFSFPSVVDFFQIQVLDAEESVTANAYLGDTLMQSVKQGTFFGLHSASVFNGPVYGITLGFINGPIRFDRVVIDLTEGDGPELYDNVSFNTLTVTAVPEPSIRVFFACAMILLGAFLRARRACE